MNTGDVLSALSTTREANTKALLTFILCYKRVYNNTWPKDVWRVIWKMVCTPYFDMIYKSLSFDQTENDYSDVLEFSLSK